MSDWETEVGERWDALLAVRVCPHACRCCCPPDVGWLGAEQGCLVLAKRPTLMRAGPERGETVEAWRCGAPMAVRVCPHACRC